MQVLGGRRGATDSQNAPFCPHKDKTDGRRKCVQLSTAKQRKGGMEMGGKGEVAASAGAMLEAHTQELGKHRMGEGGM